MVNAKQNKVRKADVLWNAWYIYIYMQNFNSCTHVSIKKWDFTVTISVSCLFLWYKTLLALWRFGYRSCHFQTANSLKQNKIEITKLTEKFLKRKKNPHSSFSFIPQEKSRLNNLNCRTTGDQNVASFSCVLKTFSGFFNGFLSVFNLDSILICFFFASFFIHLQFAMSLRKDCVVLLIFFLTHSQQVLWIRIFVKSETISKLTNLKPWCRVSLHSLRPNTPQSGYNASSASVKTIVLIFSLSPFIYMIETLFLTICDQLPTQIVLLHVGNRCGHSGRSKNELSFKKRASWQRSRCNSWLHCL